jgi:hypothetical protein
MSASYLTFHRAPERRAHFAAQDAPFFDPVTKAWIITEPNSCERLLASPDARPATYSDDYAVLQERFGIDFSNVVFAFAHLPVCLHQDPHHQARRRFAEFLAARKSALAACIPKAVDAHLRILRQEGRVEMMGQVLEPLLLTVLATLTDVEPAAAAGCRTGSIIFDKAIGTRKRRRADAELGLFRKIIASRLGPQASDEEVGMRVAFFVLARDATLGTLGESLHSILADNSGRRLSEIRYPETPPETGVPYIERIVIKPLTEGEIEFKPGDRLRIYLQAFAYSGSARERARIFGVGSHSCLGRPMTLDLWREIVSGLATIPLYAEAVSHTLRTDNYVFLCPQQLTVRLHS